MLTIEDIQQACASRAVYTRGLDLYRSGGVGHIHLVSYDSHDLIEVSAPVRGQGQPQYESTIFLTQEEQIDDYFCDCPAGAGQWGGMCKHCTALALAYRDTVLGRSLHGEQTAPSPPATSQALLDLIEQLKAPLIHESQAMVPGSVRLLPELFLQGDPTSSLRYGLAPRVNLVTGLRIAAAGERSYVVKNLALLLDLVQRSAHHAYGKSLAFPHTWDVFDPQGQALLHGIRAGLDANGIDLKDAAQNHGQTYRYLKLPDSWTAAILTAHIGSTIPLDGVACRVRQGDPTVRLRLEPLPEGGARLLLPRLHLILAGTSP